MRRSLTSYAQKYLPASTENDSSLSSDLDLLRPRIRNVSRDSRFSKTSILKSSSQKAVHPLADTRCEHVQAKLLLKGKQPSCPACSLSRDREVTFADNRHWSNSESNSKICRKGRSTPRIVRAIRKNSRKLDRKKDRSVSPDVPRADNSKSSVVILYHGESGTPLSTKTPLEPTKSDHVPQSQSVTTQYPSPHRARLVETQEKDILSRFWLLRRRATFRRYRQAYSRRETLWKKDCPKKSTCFGLAASRLAKKSTEENRKREKSKILDDASSLRCSSSDEPLSEPMAHCFSARKEAEIGQSCHLTHRMQSDPRDRGDQNAFISVNDGEDCKRVFPFQPTPSGNLKVIPNQVVFESKKVSVLVADPRRTKVNVRAELSRPVIDNPRCNSDFSTPTRLADFPSSVTPAAIEQFQDQKKLLYPKVQTHPRNSTIHRPRMDQTFRQAPSIDNVPLSSLGFTCEQPIDWENIFLPEKTDLYQELARRITNYKNADCIVCIDEDEFHCHLLVLQSYSVYFDERNCKEHDLTDSTVSSRAFSIIYDWMIGSTSESYQLLRRDNILEVFTAAQYLGIKELEEQCWAFIDNDEVFSEDTAFMLFLEAKKMDNSPVMELMIPRIMKFFLLLVGTKDFLELSVDELCRLLKSNYICVNSEMEVLMSAVRWLMHDWNARKQHTLELLKCVRFGLIAPWQLVDVKRNPENPEFMEIMSYPEVQKMVDDGLAFVIIKYWYGNQTEDYYRWIDLLGLTEPTNRNWAGEDKNYVTYREFLLYLEEYQKTKIPELRVRARRVRPTPPNSPPKDYPEEIAANYVQDQCHIDAASLYSPNTEKHRDFSKCFSRTSPTDRVAQGLQMPPEILQHYLSSVDGSQARGSGLHRGSKRMEEQQPAVCPATFEARGKPIKTIKTPAFFWNHEERTSSLSELTEDPDRVNLEQEEATGDNVARNRMENRRAESKVSGKGFEEDESSSHTEILHRLQRISNSAIALGKNDYFAEKSLFFADREAILVFGGVDPHEIYGRPGNLGRDIYRFRPEQNIWEFAGEMPEARHHHSVAYLMGRVYLVGGADPGASDPHKRSMAVATVWSYDPTNKTWTREPEMLTTRKNFGLVVSHGKMYALGGQDRNGIALNLVEAFDPSEGTWKEIQAMSIARVGPASIKYRELIWVAGGMTKSKKELFSRDVECYDPLKNLWLKAEPLRSPRCFASFYVMSEFLYVIGGASPTENGTESVATLDIWDSKLGLWKQKAEMAIPRHGHCTGSIGNQLLIIGGVTTAFMKTLNSVECYCYDLDKWMKGVASLPHAISGHGVVSLPPANLLNDR